MCKGKTISEDYKRCDITFSGSLDDISYFWCNICDFIYQNRSMLYKKSRYHVRCSSAVIVDNDFAQQHISIVAKGDFEQKLLNYLYIEQKNESIADYSVIAHPATSELACNW